MAPTLCAGFESRGGVPWQYQTASPECRPCNDPRDACPGGSRVRTSPAPSRPPPWVLSSCGTRCSPTLLKLNKRGLRSFTVHALTGGSIYHQDNRGVSL